MPGSIFVVAVAASTYVLSMWASKSGPVLVSKLLRCSQSFCEKAWLHSAPH